jgi:hypothetical protein
MREMNNQITVATLNGKSYYKIINFLKSIELSYNELSPIEAINSGTKVIITSEKESTIFKKKNIIIDSELNENPLIIKAKILRNLTEPFMYEQLIIGIDPGKRIGISIFYLYDEIESIVLTCIECVLNLVCKILTNLNAKRKIVRIGDGDRSMANSIAINIKTRFKEFVDVEIVDERGTSSNSYSKRNRRIFRDKSSARLIAFRNGKVFDLKI